jgi:acetyl-CoA carboxylase biotin carboxyl carrier protein
MVGTYYASPSPDSPAFVKVGDTVKKGQPLAILEAMKIMNELEAEFDCKIIDILVTDGQAVEFDMPLFAVEKL